MNIINYNLFEKCKFKDYEINDDQNKKLLNILQDFVLDTKESGLLYKITGSLALAIYTGKIYRTWKDVDILTDNKNFIDIVNYLPVNKWMYSQFHNFNIRMFNCHYSPELKLEILMPSNFNIRYDQILIEAKQQILLPIVNPYNILQWKKEIKKQRPSDIDDIEFYSKII